MAKSLKIHESDVRGILAIGGVIGFFIVLLYGMVLVSEGKLLVDDLLLIVAYVGTFVGSGVAWYFGSKRNING